MLKYTNEISQQILHIYIVYPYLVFKKIVFMPLLNGGKYTYSMLGEPHDIFLRTTVL